VQPLFALLFLIASLVNGGALPEQVPPPATSGTLPAPVDDKSRSQATSRPDDNRLPAPSAAAIAVALKDLKTTFQQEYEKHSASDKHKLAVALLTTAGQSGNDPATQFALYGEAREVAIAAGDCKTAIRAIDDLCGAFRVNQPELKSKAASSLVQMHLSPSDSAGLAVFLHAGAVEAIELRDYASAVRLAGAEETAAAHCRQDGLIAAAQANGRRARGLLVQTERGEIALKKLKENPNDPQANLDAGRFLCFVQKDWDRGLPLLEKGSDAELKSLAASDMAHPSDLKSVMYIAGKWWDLSVARHDEETPLRERAAAWYRQALPLANGLELVLAERRSADSDGGVDRPHVVILKADYGIEGKTFSAVSQIQAAIDADPDMPICADDHLVGDPAPHVGKHLVLSYRVGANQVDLDLNQNAVFMIPAFPDEGIVTPGASQSLRIVKARYGGNGVWVDVTQEVAKFATSPSAEIPAGSKMVAKDPAFGVRKHTVILYEFQGRRYVRIADNKKTKLQP
jgi:hypothetical protein